MSDASELAVARAYSTTHEAHLACSVLHAAGLDARVADEHIVTADWFMSNAVGGVKVVVRAEDFTTARELLENHAVVADDDAPPQTSGGDDPDQDVCPRCGGRTWVPVTFRKGLAVLTWSIIGIPLLPLWPPWRQKQCGHCGRVA